MDLLKDKVAIVTGGSRGIGEAIAMKLAENGANIAFTFASSEEKAKIVEQNLLAKGIKAKAYKSNAASFSDCESLVNDVMKEFGKIDISCFQRWDI